MKFIPILFSTPMVNAILGNRKTMTRRTNGLELVNNDPDGYEFMFELDYITNGGKTGLEFFFTESYGLAGTKSRYGQRCPYGQIGDVLWVREKFQLVTPYGPEDYYFGYADNSFSDNEASDKYYFCNSYEWKPSIHMPKEACRIFLEITNIRVERLRDITQEDAIAEGIKTYFSTLFQEDRYHDYLNQDSTWRSPISSFESLWQSINGHESWDSNPWVWVIEFKRIEKPSNFFNDGVSKK